MEKSFNSKYNIGLGISENINIELGGARALVERGAFDKAFIKYTGIMSSIPIKKINKQSSKRFKALDLLYLKAQRRKDNKLLYKIIVKYREILIGELDANNMYLPSMRDTSQFV